MNKLKLLSISFIFLFSALALHAQEEEKGYYDPGVPMPEKYQPESKIDNMGYWRRMAKEGIVPVQPKTKIPEAIKNSSRLFSPFAITEDSEDIPVTDLSSTQSENSIFVDPSNNNHALNSNNSTSASGSVFGANDFKTDDGGDSWYGNLEGTGGTNSGDPAVAISNDGRMYNGFIHSSGGQGVAYSEDNGDTWTSVEVAPSPGGFGSMLDKNHLWIDNSLSSPYEGNVYSAWTAFGGSNNNEIEVVSSSDGGVSWSQKQEISSEVNAGNHNQGVNLGTGPDGEVYAIWAIYDSWPTDENAIAMARSYDGGQTWETFRIIEDIRGIRNSETSKNMRVNAFPSMDVDISNGPNRGTIYITWTNIGYPGENDGPDMDIYMIKSTDDGDTWSEPIKVNQDESGLGTEHYFPWISCDPVTGSLSVIYYDDRNVSPTQAEVYVSTSLDGGDSWEDMLVSDVAFTPSPIPGLAGGYMGDYLGIDSYGGWTYPVWADNRSGTVMSYVSPFLSGPPPNQPWIVYESHEINDFLGNNNGLFDYDESLSFNVALSNIGDQPASDVNVTLSTESPFVTINDATENFGDFGVDETIDITSAFGVEVAPEIPDGTNVEFTMTAVDADDSTFVTGFTVEAHAPALAINGMTVTETEGDMNGFLDPGEEGTITVTLANPGDYDEDQVIASLQSSSDDITVVSTISNLGSIEAGTEAMAEFSIVVSETAQEGTSVLMPFEANSDLHSVQKDFTVKIGVIVEDWESGGFTSFNWINESASPWITVTDEVYEGDYAVRSGDIDDSQTSELTINYGVLAEDSIKFYVKASSESGYDYLKFFIDGDLIEQWSGETEWQYVAFPVLEGEHTFTWSYEKDGSVSSGSDAGWVDYIEFPPALRTTAFAGADMETCVNTTVAVAGEATLFDVTEWSTSGTGTFEDASELTTIYTPSEEDYNNGEVELTLTATGPAETITSTMLVTFYNLPEVTIDAAPEGVCAGDSLMIESASEVYTSMITWMTEGDGTFNDVNVLGGVYHPGEGDIANGTVTLKLIGSGMSNCEADTAEITFDVYPAPTATFAAENAEICSDESVSMTLSLTGTAPFEMMMNGTTLTAENEEFSHEMMMSETGYVYLESVTDANGCTVMMADSLMVDVKPLPEFTLAADSSVCHNHEVTLDVTAEGAASYSWMPGEMNTAEITVDSTGAGIGGTITYTATVTHENGCMEEKSIDITFEDCTGIPENERDITFAIFPNPSKGVFKLQLKAEQPEEVSVQIVNQNGKEVYSRKHISFNEKYEQDVDLTHLADGVYFLKVITDNYIHTEKVVINK